MALAVVDFIHTKDIPEQLVEFPAEGVVEQIFIRELNSDPATGARSLVVTLPPRLSVNGGHWTCDLELLVLDGGLRSGSHVLERYGYVFLPAGIRTEGIQVGESGVSILVFTSGSARMVLDTDDGDGASRDQMVGPLHVADVPWETPYTPDFPAGAGRKTMRNDPETGQGFWILGLLPHWTSAKTEWHEFTEENYILEGSIQTAEGLMVKGSYLSHAAGEDTAHGPMRSRDGSLLITRARGPFKTTYEESDIELSGEWR